MATTRFMTRHAGSSMPRYARIKSQTQVYHIMLRGNNREKIFIDEEDKARMIDTLGDKKKAEEYFRDIGTKP